jgi:ornithine cyclodeaminase/alanine dehydrogenase-like protein (mu-crystallin family)
VEAIPLVRKIERVIVWGRDFAKAQRFAREQGRLHRIEIQAAKNVTDAVGCDIVCTTTASTTPLFSSVDLSEGVHLNVVGSSFPSAAEVDSQTVRCTRFFVDYKESALALAGEFRAARAQGLVDDQHILGSIGDVLLGRVVGRVHDRDRTLFKSLGMVCEDLISASCVYESAREQDVGSVVDF